VKYIAYTWTLFSPDVTASNLLQPVHAPASTSRRSLTGERFESSASVLLLCLIVCGEGQQKELLKDIDWSRNAHGNKQNVNNCN
jgi:hypothetical protein